MINPQMLQRLRMIEEMKRRQEMVRQQNNPVAQIEREVFFSSQDVNINQSMNIGFETEMFSHILE